MIPIKVYLWAADPRKYIRPLRNLWSNQSYQEAIVDEIQRHAKWRVWSCFVAMKER